MDYKKLVDDNGQPVIFFQRQKVVTRTIDELIGICKGVIADGQVVTAEAEFLFSWLQCNNLVLDEYPACYIMPRLSKYLEDGMIDTDEGEELRKLLLAATGEDNELHGGINMSSSLPLNEPPPEITFNEKTFCFTGELAFGPRREAAAIVDSLGGFVASAITKKIDYLVLGCMGSRDWLHSTHGLKISKAVSLREDGNNISIISEDHWIEAVKANTADLVRA